MDEQTKQFERIGRYLIAPSVDRDPNSRVWCVVAPEKGDVYWSPDRQKCVEWALRAESDTHRPVGTEGMA